MVQDGEALSELDLLIKGAETDGSRDPPEPCLPSTKVGIQKSLVPETLQECQQVITQKQLLGLEEVAIHVGPTITAFHSVVR